MRRPPAGRWGVWLVAQREAPDRDMGQTEAFHALRKFDPEAFPWGESSRASYSHWEYGLSEPDARQQAALLRFYDGAQAPDMGTSEEAAPQPSSDVLALVTQVGLLVEQLDADRAVIVDLVRDLRQSQAERDGLLTAFLAAVQQARENPGGLAPAADPDGEPPAIGPLDAARL